MGISWTYPLHSEYYVAEVWNKIIGRLEKATFIILNKVGMSIENSVVNIGNKKIKNKMH